MRDNLEKDYEYWKCGLWKDETKFGVFGVRVLLMFGERSQRRIKNIVPRVKHSDGTIMLWECLRASETMNIVKVE